MEGGGGGGRGRRGEGEGGGEEKEKEGKYRKNMSAYCALSQDGCTSTHILCRAQKGGGGM